MTQQSETDKRHKQYDKCKMKLMYDNQSPTSNYTVLSDMPENCPLMSGKETHFGVGIPDAKHGNSIASYSRN